MNALATAAAYSLVFLLGEGAARFLRVAPQWTRPAVHVVCGLISVIVPLWLTRAEILALALFFALVMAASMRLSLFKSIHAVIRRSWGEVFFPLGVALAALLYLPATPNLYALSILVLTISDPLANLLGSRARGRRLLFGKSLQGSLAFFASSTAICLVFLPPWEALLVSAALTVTEAVSPFGSDNLTIAVPGAIAIIIV